MNSLYYNNLECKHWERSDEGGEGPSGNKDLLITVITQFTDSRRHSHLYCHQLLH